MSFSQSLCRRDVPKRKQVAIMDTSIQDSYSSAASTQRTAEPSTPERLRHGLKCSMDRKGSVGSAGILSPSETSCSTPVNPSGLLLATRATSATITDTEKEDNDSEVGSTAQ